MRDTAPITEKNQFLHLTSFSIKEGTMPDNWPLSELLVAGSTVHDPPSRLTIEYGNESQENVKGVFRHSFHPFLNSFKKSVVDEFCT